MRTQTETNEARKKALVKRLEAGKPPIIRKYIDGAEAILVKFGIDPSTVYIPDPALTYEKNNNRRIKFRANLRYRKERARIGKYTPRTEAEANQEELERVKRRILVRLHEEII